MRTSSKGLLRAQAFDSPISNAVVISMIQSHTGGDWVKTRHQAVTSAGFQMKQEEDGLDIGHNTEVYGWIALPKGTGSIGGLDYEAIVTPNTVTRKMHIILSRFARTRVSLTGKASLSQTNRTT